MNQKGLAPILIVLLIAVAGIGGYFVYTNYSNLSREKSGDNQSNQTKPPLPATPSQITKSEPSSSPQCSESESKPSIKPSINNGWIVFTGNLFVYQCDVSFSIEYPSQWQQEGYILYPFGNTNSNQDPRIILAAGGSGWYEELKIINKTFPSGTASYSWGKPKDTNYIIGFASIAQGNNDFVITARNIPLDKAQELENVFNQMLSTFKFTQ